MLGPDPNGQGGREGRKLRYWMSECSPALRLVACPPRTLQQRRRPRERHTPGPLRSSREDCGHLSSRFAQVDQVGQLRNDEFLKHECEGKYSFTSDPPNAILSASTHQKAGRIARSRRTRLGHQRALHESSEDRRTIRNGLIIEVVAVVVHG